MVTHTDVGLAARRMHAKLGPSQCIGWVARKAAVRWYCMARKLGMEGSEHVAVRAGGGVIVSSPPLASAPAPPSAGLDQL
jgi:hypothetical protein